MLSNCDVGETLMLKLKLQYFRHQMQRANSLGKTLMLGKIERKRRRGRQMVGWQHWLNGHEFEQALGDSEGQGSLACCRPWGCKELDTTEELNTNNGVWSDNEMMGSGLKLHDKKKKFFFQTWEFISRMYLGHLKIVSKCLHLLIELVISESGDIPSHLSHPGLREAGKMEKSP